MTSSIQEDKIAQALEFIGLQKNERAVFWDLLKNGASTATEISKRTHVHRSNSYDALNMLVEKGFVSQKRTSTKNLFQAMDVKKIRDYVDQKSREIEEVIPLMQQLTKETTNSEDVRILKGTFAAREELLSLLDLNAEISVYGASKEALEVFGMGFLKDFHKKRMKRKIKMRHIYNADMTQRVHKLNQMKYTQARYIPKQYGTYVATTICKDTVLLLIFSNPASIIAIKHKEIAQTYNQYFDILWSKGKTK